MAWGSAQAIQGRQRTAAQFAATRGAPVALDAIFVFPFELFTSAKRLFPADGKFLRGDGVALIAVCMMTHGVSPFPSFSPSLSSLASSGTLVR